MIKIENKAKNATFRADLARDLKSWLAGKLRKISILKKVARVIFASGGL